MKFFSFSLFFLFFSYFSFSQKFDLENITLDSRYREDQFYIGATYNLLLDKPQGVSQYNFSRSFLGGFIRDYPLNAQRNIGVGIGLGYNYNLIYTNIRSLAGRLNIVNQNKDGISTNYFSFHGVEIPLEFRFRTSTAASHKFWRCYVGLKPIFYMGGNQSTKARDGNTSSKIASISNVWGVSYCFSVGYNTWNIFVQHGFQSFLKGEYSSTGENLQMPLVQIGIIFYIL